MSENRRPILVTGSHRSGSTWVGKMIAASPDVGYIWEPLNPAHKPGIFNAPVPHYYTWISDRNSSGYEGAMRDTLAFRYNLSAQAKSIRDIRGLGAMLFGYSGFCLYRLTARRPLLKDPFALFAAEWIASEFNAQVVVLIRHPAAFINSIIKFGRRHPFSHFLEQPGLIADKLPVFRTEIERLASNRVEIIDEAALLWRVTHFIIAKYRCAHPDWLFVRHEDLSRDPVPRFEPVFHHLGLEYTSRVKQKIEASTCQGNPVERPGESWPAFAKLDSRENMTRWTKRLNTEQIARIRSETEDVWPSFYTDEDWYTEGEFTGGVRRSCEIST
jgi:hypothetical protein